MFHFRMVNFFTLIHVLIFALYPSLPQGNISASTTSNLSDSFSLEWHNSNSMPYHVFEAAMATDNQRIFVTGGHDGTAPGGKSSVISTIVTRTGEIANWQTTTPLPAVRYGHSSVVAKNHLYVIGGYTITNKADTVQYAPILENGTVGNWTTTTPLLNTLYRTAAVSNNNSIYVIGGWSDGLGKVLNNVYRAEVNDDGSINNWISQISLPVPLHAHQAVLYYDKIYVIGGLSTSNQSSSSVYMAQIQASGNLGNWVAVNSLPVPLHHASVVIWQNFIVVSGGRTQVMSGNVDTVYIAKILTAGQIGPWEKITSLPSPLATHLSAATNRNIYVLGGSSSSTVLEGSIFAHDPNTPVIFIPGIMGSRLFHGEEQIWPDACRLLVGKKICPSPWKIDGLYPLALNFDGIHSVIPEYDDIFLKEGQAGIVDEFFDDFYVTTIKHFTDLGYIPNKNFFIFPYDWRFDIGGTTVDTLDLLIDRAIAESGADRVAIVAHSMGGLVAREYVSDSDRALKVKQIITLGTPYLGTPKALAILKGLAPIINKPLLGDLPDRATAKHITANMPGFYELMPSRAYFDLKGGGFYSVTDQSPILGSCSSCLSFEDTYKTSFTPNINPNIISLADRFHSEIDRMDDWGGIERVTIIYGFGMQTISGIQTMLHWKWNSMDYGLLPYPVTTREGDGTVTTLSSSLSNYANMKDFTGIAETFSVVSEHMELAKNPRALAYVDYALGRGQLPGSMASQSVEDTTGGTQILATGVKAIHVHDAFGNHTGPSQEQNELIEEKVPGSLYFPLAEDAASISLPAGKDFTLFVVPFGNVPVDVTVIRTSNDGNISKLIYTGIPTTEKSLIHLSGDPYVENTWQLDKHGDGTIVTSVTPAVSYTPGDIVDSTPPISTIELQGVKKTTGWFEGPVTVTLSASDQESGVQRIEYAFGNNLQVQIYTGPFVIDANQVTTITAIAFDNAGNVQQSPTTSRIGPERIYLPTVLK